MGCFAQLFSTKTERPERRHPPARGARHKGIRGLK